MPVRPCPISQPCPPDEPLDNFSSEANDTLDFFSTFFAGTPPPLLHNWSSTECGETFISTISQSDADLQARAAAQNCVCVNNGTCGQILNNPQTACVTCPDGAQSCYTVPGGLFSAATQQEADSLAFQSALTLVRRNLFCFDSFLSCGCLGSPYSSTVTSAVPVTWTLIGFLPPGFTIAFTLTSATITGVPTMPGQFTFQLEGQTLEGPKTIKTFTISVIQITTNSLPPFSIGVPYSFQLQASGGSGNYLWKIVSGTLPPGLVLENSGLIHGTPT